MSESTKDAIEVLPLDKYNRELMDNTHPGDWINPEPAAKYNLVVIGAGTAGLVSAAGAAGLGGKVALIERHLMGGDCLNYGCVPSKAVIRSSRAYAEAIKALAGHDNLLAVSNNDFTNAMERMRRLRARISSHDSAIRFKNEYGIDIFIGEGKFTGPDTVEVDGKKLHFSKAVIATGARPFVPPIEGLHESGYLTNETVFSLTERPEKLVVIGGGPIGCELAQAFHRLGSDVTIIQHGPQFLNREDPDAADILSAAFKREGIRVLLNSDVKKVIQSESGVKELHIEQNGEEIIVNANEILIGAGRIPNVENLNCEAAGVKYDTRHGVLVNDNLRTTNSRIFAAGDICLKHKFTHTADASARIVIQNALFKGRKKYSSLVVPWCTYTDPEIAHVGMYECDAKEAGIPIDTYKRELNEVDRAILDGEDEGFVKIHTKKGTDTIVGATIVASHAGDMISELSVAMAGKTGLGALANVIHPYPTQAEAIKQLGDAYNRKRLTPFVKNLFEKWLAWTR